MYKVSLFENAVADENNSILKNATIAAPLKHLSNFRLLLKMPLINCKAGLKLRWTKHFILAWTGVGKNYADCNNITFIIKNTKLYVPVVTLSPKDNKKLSKILSKGFKISVYWNEYETKNENENTTNEYGYFLESNFVGVNRPFVLIYMNRFPSILI